MFTGLNQVAVQFVELQWVFLQRIGKVAAAFDVGLDGGQQFLHAGVFMTLADDVKGLHQRHAGTHHGGELTAENGNVGGLDLFLAAKQGRGFFLDLGRVDALTAQVGLDQGQVGAVGFALDDLSLAVLAFPDKGAFL